jgi:TIR domain
LRGHDVSRTVGAGGRLVTAQIFLSYARADQPKAEKLARALESAGHSVWWDLQVHAGARFSAEINSALKSAELIVVLWSHASIESAWVQDEAAVGRDTERLVPVLIDRVDPPLGFRQYQAIDLSQWSGRGKPPNLERIVAALGRAPQRPQIAGPASAKKNYLRAGVIIAVPLAAVIALGLAWRSQSTGAQSLVLAIAPASTGDAAASRDFAAQLALDLNRFQSIYLAPVDIRQADPNDPEADYQASVSVNRSGPAMRVDLALKTPGAGVTWADTIEGRSDRIVDLRQQSASELSTVMRCALGAGTGAGGLGHADYRLYLDGCVTMSSEYSGASARDLLPLFRRLAQAHPRFVPAQTMLALACNGAIETASEAQRRPLALEGKAALAQAKALAPDNEDVIAAEAQFHPFNSGQWRYVFPILEHGLRGNPNSPLLLGLLSEELMRVGRIDESAVAAKQALGFNQLSPNARVDYINTLIYSDRPEQGLNELRMAETIWPKSSILEDTRFRFDLRYGDPRAALTTVQRRGSEDLIPGAFGESLEKFLEARINQSPANVESALQSFRERYRRNPADIPAYIQALGTFGRIDEAFQISRNPVTLDSMEASTDILFRPHMRKLYSDPRFIDLASRLGLLNYWRESKIWPDFCRESTLPYDCQKEAAKYR